MPCAYRDRVSAMSSSVVSRGAKAKVRQVGDRGQERTSAGREGPTQGRGGQSSGQFAKASCERGSA